MPFYAQDQAFLDLAIANAEKGDARVFPNPRVGAVVVRDGEVIAEGFHRRCGEAHAEVAAKDAVGGSMEACTVYVSLEPCGHEGRTPSCAKMLIAEKVKRVVYAVSDPGPGQGGSVLLKEAGIEVDGPHPSPRALEVLEPFMKNLLHGETYFLHKWAMTLDGHMALGNGDSKWVSGEKSRENVHRTRTICDGILVGARTVLADTPRLDVRFGVEGPVPRPIVWDPKGKTVDHPCWELWAQRDPVVITSDDHAHWPACVKTVSFSNPRLLGKALMALGIHMVLVEGGAACHGWFMDEGLADALEVYVAPKVCGGADSLSPVGGQGVSRMADSLELKSLRYELLGSDLWLKGSLKAYHPDVALYGKDP